MRTEYKNLGYAIAKKIYYTDKADFLLALAEMPDYECWDQERRVLVKDISKT